MQSTRRNTLIKALAQSGSPRPSRKWRRRWETVFSTWHRRGVFLTINPSQDPHNGVVSSLCSVRPDAARQRYSALIGAQISPQNSALAGEYQLTTSRFVLFSFDTRRRIRILLRPHQYFEGKFRRSPGAGHPLAVAQPTP